MIKGSCPEGTQVPLDSILMAAIREHHAQNADDRCWMDDNRLYEVAGLPKKDFSVGNKEAMLKNCERFINGRCWEGGNWTSYADLEAKCERLEEELFATRLCVAFLGIITIIFSFSIFFR